MHAYTVHKTNDVKHCCSYISIFNTRKCRIKPEGTTTHIGTERFK